MKPQWTSVCDHSMKGIEQHFLGCCYATSCSVLHFKPADEITASNNFPKPNEQYLNFVCKILIPGEKLLIIQLTYKLNTSLHLVIHITHVCIVQHAAPWLHGISCRRLPSDGRCCHKTSHQCRTHDFLSYHTQPGLDTCTWQFQREVPCNKSRIYTQDSYS